MKIDSNFKWLSPVITIICLLATIFQCQDKHSFGQVDESFVLVNIRQFTRAELANVISSVNRNAPKAIIVDALFFKEKDNLSDSLLANSFHTSPSQIFLISNLLDTYRVNSECIVAQDVLYPIRTLLGPNVEVGYANTLDVVKDDKIITSQYFESAIFQDDTLKFISSQVADFILKDSSDFVPARNKCRAKDIVLQHNRISNYHIVDLDYQKLIPKLNALNFENKVVALGYLGPSNEDKKFTEFCERNCNEPDTYGLIILVECVMNILTHVSLQLDQTNP